jgi:hypothetical protein
MMLERLKECFEEWLQIHGFDYDYWFYSPTEWRSRGESYLCDSKLIFAAENQLMTSMNFGSDFEDELQALAEGFGYYFEFGNHWNFGFYPVENAAPFPSTNTPYSALLRDARWQTKRKRIALRSGGKCENCDCTGKRLEVHHCYYRYGRLPWQYPDGALLHLCTTCHKERAKAELRFRGFLPQIRSSEIKVLRTALENGLYWFPRNAFFSFVATIGYDIQKCREKLDSLAPLRSHRDERDDSPS